MKNRFFILLIGLTLLSPVLLFAQKDSSLVALGLKSLNVKFGIAGSMSGLGTSASAVGENVAWPQSDASCLSWNPAALGFLTGRSVIADWVPGIQPDLNAVADFDKEINQALDDAVTDNGRSDSEVFYPSTFANGGQQSGLTGFALAVPFQAGGMRFGIGFGFVMPLTLDLQILGSGFEAEIDQEEELTGEGLTSIRMRARASINGHLGLNVHQLIFGAGCDIGRGWALGFSMNRYRFRFSSQASASVDAIISINGAEYAFNDPNDPKIDFTRGETNRLDQSFSMRFDGTAWGYKIGLSKRVTSWFNLGLVFTQSPNIELSGWNETVIHSLAAMKDSSDLDPTKLDLSKPTLTEEEITINDLSPQIGFPRSTSIGIVLGTGIKFSFRYTAYSGDFSFGYQADRIDALKMKQGVGMGLDFKYFFMGASAIFAEEYFVLPSGSKPEDFNFFDREPMNDTILPQVNLGFRIPTLSGLWLDGLVGAQPAPVLRLTARYTF